MKKMLILGAGTGGTILANRMRRRLERDWKVTVVDPEPTHLYQPGLLFLPFGARNEDKMRRPRGTTLDPRVEWKVAAVDAIDPDRRTVGLKGGGKLRYDLLVIATGTEIRPDMTPGLLGPEWRKSVFDFYTLEGATALREKLERFDYGRLVVNVVEMPIKCPVAPLEFLFLADDFFRRRGVRDRIELVYATPLDKAFTKPVAASLLGNLLDARNIVTEPDYMTGEVDGEKRLLRSYDEREVPYDLLVTIPTHTGASFAERSGIGNELGFIPTDKHTLEVKGLSHVFAVGDATDLPTSKAGSVAHFQAEVLEENLVRVAEGRAPCDTFDGHANCFIETGGGKAMLLDFNYDVEPLPGTYPLPWIGPFTLLKESRRNHWGKLAFRNAYWNRLLPGKWLPAPARMWMAGKDRTIISARGA